MEQSRRLKSSEMWIGWGVLLILIGWHLIPYIGQYTLPSGDYFSVLRVLNALQHPEYFSGQRLSEALVSLQLNSSPVYYWAIVFPLTFLFPPKWVLLVIGIGIMLGSIYLAGWPWETWEDMLVAVLLTVILLHIFVRPIEGNRRSFSALFLLLMLHDESVHRYLYRSFLVALSAGIYPPVSLVILGYYSLRNLYSVYDSSLIIRDFVVKGVGMCVLFLAVLMPYWTDLLFGRTFSVTSQWTGSVTYQWDSLYGFLTTFLSGHKLALFRDVIDFNIFLILVVFLSIEWLVLGKRLAFDRRYGFLLITACLLWGLAHLLLPLIYWPFKYTRVTLILSLALPVARNLPATMGGIRVIFFESSLSRLFVYFLTIPALVFLGLFVLFPSQLSGVMVPGLLSDVWWRFVFVLPLIFPAALIWPERMVTATTAGCVMIIIMLIIGVFLPADTVNHWEWRGVSLEEFDGMYRFLRNTPPGTLVAGPLDYMIPVPAFSSRPVFVSSTSLIANFACERSKDLMSVYFQDSLLPIETFMRRNKINYLLVDRQFFREKIFITIARCTSSGIDIEDPALDRVFPEANWRHGRRLFLVSYETIRSMAGNS